MKKIITVLLIALLTFSLISVAYADSNSENDFVTYDFIRNYSLDSVTSNGTKIVEDNNWYKDTTVTCTWKESGGPMSLIITCHIKYNGQWSFYSSGTLSKVGDSVSFTISGGEPFKLYAIKASGNDGSSNFTVALY